MKALFIPLKAEYFDAFERGDKDTEYRLYGHRWNERCCEQGRAVTLSRGYGIQRRLRGSVAAFGAFPVQAIADRDAFEQCYGPQPDGRMVAVIRINVYRDDKWGLRIAPQQDQRACRMARRASNTEESVRCRTTADS
jgi:hypothetical protein